MKSLIQRFNSITSLKVNLEKEIEDTEFQVQEYSNVLGEKIRSNEETSADDPDFLALKAKLEGYSHDKKADAKKLKAKPEKKKKPKKGVSDKWYNLNEILIYNGIGLKGELELYFKAVDELKAKLENLQRTLSTLNNVMEKGLKEDMGCISFRGSEGILEISFLKSSGVRENFSLKSIYSGNAIPVENMIKIGV